MNKIFKNAGLTIAFATFYGYLFTYIYESGVCFYYDIPRELIDISVQSILSKVGLIGLLLFYIEIFVFGFIFGHNEKEIPIRWKIFIHFFIFCILLFSFLASERKITDILFFLIPYLIILYIDIIDSIIFGGKNLTVTQRILESDKQMPKGAIYRLQNALGSDIVLATYVLLASLLIVNSFGRIWSRNKFEYHEVVNYSTINNKEKVIVLRIYGNRYICGKVDIDKKIISPDLIVINNSENRDLILRPIKLKGLKKEINKSKDASKT